MVGLRRFPHFLLLYVLNPSKVLSFVRARILIMSGLHYFCACEAGLGQSDLKDLVTRHPVIASVVAGIIASLLLVIVGLLFGLLVTIKRLLTERKPASPSTPDFFFASPDFESAGKT